MEQTSSTATGGGYGHSGGGGKARVLMIAEKPSIARTIAEILSKGRHNTRNGLATPVHEWDSVFLAEKASFSMTSVLGHVYSTNFNAEYQDWGIDPAVLFTAPIKKEEANPGQKLVKHLQKESKHMDYLVLWLDCDREGENICFEVMSIVQNNINRNPKKKRQIFRAKFSAITPPDIERAMHSLVSPNEDEARSVDARQELDLKIGVAFTRFQTRYFQGKYGDLDATLISYGPCQTPTLGFCVERHDAILGFVPKPFWTISPIVTHDSRSIKLKWQKGNLFDKSVVLKIQKTVKAEDLAKVKSITRKEGSKPRPTPLNTIELLKVASNNLHLSPSSTMHIAERLYIAGYISYPRTESSAYPVNFDLYEPLKMQTKHDDYGDYVAELLSTGINKPRQGHDAGDHPPITPTSPPPRDLGGDDLRIYNYIARHFIATLSPDLKLSKIKIEFDIGGEIFKCSGQQVINPGFTTVMPWLGIKDDLRLSSFEGLKSCKILDAELVEGKTSPPDYLTESELISLMEKHSIGTDASISVHINNIAQRGYVRVDQQKRTLIPTQLGIALCHAYHRIDPQIVLPTVRGMIEKQIDAIARGKETYDAVVTKSLNLFLEKFKNFVTKIGDMDELFEACFTPINKTVTTANTFRSKCGKCRRFMEGFPPNKPNRMYCKTCEETYSLPPNGSIKPYKDLRCPLDDFELILFSYGNGQKRFPLCPYCYNHPTLEGMKKGMGCNQCTHPTCENALEQWKISQCSKCDFGTMVLDPVSAPNWKMDCNICNFIVRLPTGAVKIAPVKEICEDCGSQQVYVNFNKNNVPPALEGTTEYTSCVYCDELLSERLEEGFSKSKHAMFRRGGRGRGRGGRGGKRGGRGGRGGRGRGGP